VAQDTVGFCDVGEKLSYNRQFL